MHNPQGQAADRRRPYHWLRDRTVLLIAAIFLLSAGLLVFAFVNLQERLIRSMSIESAERRSAALRAFRTFYTREVVEPAQAGGLVVTHDYDKGENRGKAIPLPATLSMMIGKELAKSESRGFSVLYSAHPFPWREAEWKGRDDFARDAWQALSADPTQPFYRFETRDGEPWLRYATADVMRESCVQCHNTHPSSPKRDWKMGDVRGVLEVSFPQARAEAAAAASLHEAMLIGAVVVGLGLIGLIAVVSRMRRYSSDLEGQVRRMTQDLVAQKVHLEQSQRQFQTTVEAAPSAMVVTDSDGRIVLLNAQAERLFGYARQEILGKVVELLVPERLRTEHAALRLGVLANTPAPSRGGDHEWYALRKDGAEVPVEIGLSPVATAEGTFVIASLVDVRERRGAEEELNRFFTLSIDLLCIAGADGYFKRLNPAFERTLGWSQQELMSRPFVEFTCPEDRERTRAELAAFQDQGHRTLNFENRYVCKDGSLRWLSWNAVALPDRQLIFASAKDVTNQKLADGRLRQAKEAAEQAQSELQERVRLLALGSDIGLALARGGAMSSMLQHCTDAIVRHLDAAFARIWTVSDTEEVLELQASSGMYTHLNGPHGRVPVGKYKIGLIAQERKPHLTNHVLGDPRVSDQEWARQEGMVSFAGHPLIVEGKLVGVVAMFARHALSEAVLGALGAAADAIAVGVSRKRSEEALVHSEAEALSANRAKSEFLANMSHEIRTPMNGILGMTRLVLDSELTAKQREYLGMAYRSAESLLDIINDILDFSKIEAGKLVLDATPFSVTEWVENAMKDLSLRAHAKTLELTYEIDPEVPDTLVGDPGRLRQVLLNLVSNAIKFTEKGEVAVTVHLLSATTEEIWLRFAVRDTGIGIPADKLERIFKAFEQADTSITRTHGGTGLGLAICTRIVAMMGGTLEVDSTVGVGSRFHFNARFRTSDQMIPRAAPRTLPELRGLRVLIVDDNDTNRRILHDTLLHWHMRPYCVGSGREAIRAMREAAEEDAPFHLVLLDAMMPEMDGFGVAAALRGNREFDGAMIMMLSSADLQEDAARCRAVGIQSYLTKPVASSVLFNAVVDSMDQFHGVHGATPTPAPKAHPDHRAGSNVAESGKTAAGLRILLAEDNAINQKVAVGMLEAAGHRVTVVNNGKEAVAAVATQTFDVVLMDIQMPEMDGLQATAAIREHEVAAGGHVPIIALTAHAMKGDHERCLAAGMDGFVSKPIHPAELKQAIARQVSSPAAKVDGSPTSPDIVEVALDQNALLARVGNNLALMRDILELCPEEFARLTKDLETAILAKDARRVQLATHTLKGLLGNLGATEAYDTAANLERMGRLGELAQVDAIFERLKRQVEGVESAVARIRAELNP